MKNIRLIAAILVIMVLLNRCDFFSPTETVRGTGPIESEIFHLNAFHEIENTGIIDVNIIEGSEQEVTFSAQEEILDVIAAHVSQGRLIIGIEEDIRIKTRKGITVDIITPGVNRVMGTGTGDYYLQGGLQDELFIELTGTGDLNAYDLEVRECIVMLSGTGDARVRVVDNLDVESTGTGDVYYKGQPSIDVEITGTGSLHNEN
mgnify:FL=1